MKTYRKKKLSELHQRIITAVKFMGRDKAQKIWDFIYRDFNEYAKLALIPYDEPDETERALLQDIKENGDDDVYYDSEDVERMLFGVPSEEQIA